MLTCVSRHGFEGCFEFRIDADLVVLLWEKASKWLIWIERKSQSFRLESERIMIMAIPEADLLRIGKWCQARVPAKYLDQIRVECEIADRHVTIYESRPPWDGRGAEWIQFPIARLRYTQKTGQWQIYWRDRNLKFHSYTRKRPTKNVQSLLDYIGSGTDPIFWG